MKTYTEELYEQECVDPRIFACLLYRWVLATPESYSVLYHVLRYAAADFQELSLSISAEPGLKPNYTQIASHCDLAANLIGES